MALNTSLTINSAWISGLMKVFYDAFAWPMGKPSASPRLASQISLGSSPSRSGNVEAWEVLVEGALMGVHLPSKEEVLTKRYTCQDSSNLYIRFYDAY
jgi:hypothetical protein